VDDCIGPEVAAKVAELKGGQVRSPQRHLALLCAEKGGMVQLIVIAVTQGVSAL
jgi:hypothetical protein